jgi:glycosyltransferase involved in cell wall biosynthesis
MSRAAEVFTVVGERMRPFYSDTVGVSSDKLRVIVNGIDTTPRASETTRQEIMRELQLPEDAVLVGTAGRIAPDKNLPLLLRSAAAVIASGIRIHLVVLGEGESRAALEALARELGIASAVSFLGWRTDVRPILDVLDVFTLTSFAEGLPLALLQGMAAELPVVSTPVGDVPLVVREGHTGFLINQNEATSLSCRLRELALDPEKRARMGKAGREVILDRYDRCTMVERYMSVYQV